MNFILKSTEFNGNEAIPTRYTCYGKNVSPPLEWENPPKNTKSFVLIVDDPDTISGIWNHWIIYNIPNDITSLEEGVKFLPIPARYASNSWGEENYCGPCPPMGEHRYFFKLFALNKQIKPQARISRGNIERLMHSHIIGEASLMGKYERKYAQ